MADVTFDRGIGIETWQPEQPEDRKIQSSSLVPPRPSRDQRRRTQEEEITREQEHPVLTQIASNEYATLPRLDLILSLNRSDRNNHDFVFTGNEAITMLESPAGSSRRAPSPNDQAVDRVRKVTYASSPPESPNQDKKPLRHDSTYYSAKDIESDGSEVDYDTQARQLKDRERIIIRRQRVQRTRRLIKACRAKVHKSREEVQDAIDRLTRKFNELKTVNPQSQENLEPYYDKLQEARNRLGPDEDEYETLERKLDEEEEDLEEEENHFYSHNDLFNITVPESKLDVALSPIAEPSRVLDPDPEDMILESSLARDYLKKLEEAQRLKEGIDELENEYLAESRNADFRRKHKIPLSEETTKFLYEIYPTSHAEIINDLRTAEDALFEIRDKCIDAGLFAESDHTYERWDALCEDLLDLVSDTRDRSPLRAAAHDLHYNDTSVDFGDKRDYVNKWILQWVEDSTVGTLLLQAWIFSTYPDDTKKSEELGDERWTELVVENWDFDEAGDSANKNNRDSRLDNIAGTNLGVKRHATSTGRSGVTGSLRTLDVFPDDEVELLIGFGDPTHSFATRQLASSTGSSASIYSSVQNSLGSFTALDTVSQSQLFGNDLGAAGQTITKVPCTVIHSTETPSKSFQSTQSIVSRERNTSPHAPCPDTGAIVDASTFTPTVNNEVQPPVAMVEINPEKAIDLEHPTARFANSMAETPKELPADDKDKEVSTLTISPLRFSASDIIQSDISNNPPPHDDNSNIKLEPSISKQAKTMVPNFEISSRSEPEVHNSMETQKFNNFEHNTCSLEVPRSSFLLPTIGATTKFNLDSPVSRSRAKSEANIQPLPRTSSDPLTGRVSSLQVNYTSTIRHRRSLSPSIFNTLRKIPSFSSIRPSECRLDVKN